MPNDVVSQTTVPPATPFTTNTRKKKQHHKHRHHHKKHRHDKSKPPITEQATTSYTATATPTTLSDVSKITVLTSRTTTTATSFIITLDSTSTFFTENSYKSSATESHLISSTSDSDHYFIEETSTSVFSMTTTASSNTITSSFYRPTSRLLTPPRDQPMRETRPLSSSLEISASVSSSPFIIQPIPAKIITSRSTRVPAPTFAHNNGNNGDDSNTAYYHKAQIDSSNRDLGLGLGLGFGGFGILALTALLIQNYRNQNALRTSNPVDSNGVFFTEKPSMFKRKSASGRHSKQNSFISTKWRPQSFLGVVANVIVAKLPKRESSDSFTQFDELGTVDYDPLTYPQPLYSPVKATYRDT